MSHLIWKRFIRATALALLGVAVLSLGSTVLASGSSVTIVEKSEKYSFQPGTQSVALNGTVTWTNKSDAPHTVTSDTGAFGSDRFAKGGTFSFKFTTAGAFKYHCTVHSYMHGTIQVLAAGATLPNTAATLSASGGPSRDDSPAFPIILFGVAVLIANRLIERRWRGRATDAA